MQAFVGIPYVEHGRDYAGCDCWGLVFLFYRDVLRTPVRSYVVEMQDRQFRPRAIAPLMNAEREANWIEVNDPREGDVVLMRNGVHQNHVGIRLDGGRLLHSDGSDDGAGLSAIERLDALHIRTRIAGYFRLANAG